MVRLLRTQRDAHGLVTANGGFLSKYSVGIYSARPAPAPSFDDTAFQAEVDAWPAPPTASGEGEGVVETYTIDYGRPEPVGIVVGSLAASGARFVARTDPADPTIVQRMAAEDPLGARVTLALDADGKSLVRAFHPAHLTQATA
jgi:acetyl-CoA C-acetyltransferase